MVDMDVVIVLTKREITQFLWLRERREKELLLVVQTSTLPCKKTSIPSKTEVNKKNYLEMLIDMWEFFYIDVYGLLYTESTLYFLMTYVAMIFDMLNDIILEDFCYTLKVHDLV